MTDFNNNNRIAIFANKDKQKETQPDYSGNLTVANIEFKVALWKRTSDKGLTYLSGEVTKKDDAMQGGANQVQAPSQPVEVALDSVEDIPF